MERVMDGFQVGQAVRLAGGLGEGRLMGVHTHFGGRRWWALRRKSGSVLDVPEDAIQEADPVPTYAPGDSVRVWPFGRGTVLSVGTGDDGRPEYVVEIPARPKRVLGMILTMAVEGPRVVRVGPERIDP
jgi:hypothetical protein